MARVRQDGPLMVAQVSVSRRGIPKKLQYGAFKMGSVQIVEGSATHM